MPELRMTVQRQYYETLQRLDVVLQTVCNSFSAEGYSKVSDCTGLGGWGTWWWKGERSLHQLCINKLRHPKPPLA
jgi:hypothetical protein